MTRTDESFVRSKICQFVSQRALLGLTSSTMSAKSWRSAPSQMHAGDPGWRAFNAGLTAAHQVPHGPQDSRHLSARQEATYSLLVCQIRRTSPESRTVFFQTAQPQASLLLLLGKQVLRIELPQRHATLREPAGPRLCCKLFNVRSAETRLRALADGHVRVRRARTRGNARMASSPCR